MKFLTKTIRFTLWATFAVICGLVLISASVTLYLSPAIPDVQTLKDFKLETPMRIMSADNKLIAEYGDQRRSPLSYDQIPPRFVQALIAIEDKRFEQHWGVDPVRFTKAVIDVFLTGDKDGAGGSTLTQQVARNYFLTQQKTFTRKFTEIILALKMESELSKAEILELYINKHFLGYRSYGIQAAATVYYGADVNDLSLGQLAMIAGLHQAPSAANPIANKERAERRRNTVLRAMYENGFISKTELDNAVAEPIIASFHGNAPEFEAYYLAEMVRLEMIERFGESAYNDGYTIYTTVNSELQNAANRGVRKALLDYSRRHGYLGPEYSAPEEETDLDALLEEGAKRLDSTPVFGDLPPALVIDSDDTGLTVLVRGRSEPVFLPLDTMQWARPRITVDRVGPEVTNGQDIAKVGDIIRVEAIPEGWALAQIPQAQGAFVALSPEDGSVQALVGGFDYLLNKFNRVVQANRQPGSTFKPFIYSAAIDKGYTPATIVNDAPIVRADETLEDIWRPRNSGDRYLGPIPMRQAMYQSRNLSSIRILEDIGINYARDYSARFGFNSEQLVQDMTLVLGTTVSPMMDIARGYATFANGGYLIEPYFIQRIEDADGNIIFEASPTVVCRGCPEVSQVFAQMDTSVNSNVSTIDISPLALSIDDNESETFEAEVRYAPQVISPQTAFLMDSMLKDVVQRGTAVRARRALNRSDLAGKTGTTNNAVDAWFTGYNMDYVASAWVGYDNNQPLGVVEYGGVAALPAWIEFMQTALTNKPERSMPQPVGITRVRIDPATGLLATPNTPNAVFEYFNENNVPTEVTRDQVTIDFSSTDNGEGSNGNGEGTVESLF